MEGRKAYIHLNWRKKSVTRVGRVRGIQTNHGPDEKGESYGFLFFTDKVRRQRFSSAQSAKLIQDILTLAMEECYPWKQASAEWVINENARCSPNRFLFWVLRYLTGASKKTNLNQNRIVRTYRLELDEPKIYRARICYNGDSGRWKPSKRFYTWQQRLIFNWRTRITEYPNCNEGDAPQGPFHFSFCLFCSLPAHV